MQSALAPDFVPVLDLISVGRVALGAYQGGDSQVGGRL